MLFGLVVSILLPRLLGAEARGEYQLAVKVAGLVLAVAQWGIPEVLLQVLGERRFGLGALVGTSLVLGVCGAAVVATIVALSTPALSASLLRGVEPLLLVLCLGGSLASLVGLLGRRFIQLDGKLAIYNSMDVARTVLFLLLILAGATLAPREAVVPTVAWLLGEVALAIAAIGFVARMIARPSTWRVRRALAGELARSGAPIQLGLLAMFIGS